MQKRLLLALPVLASLSLTAHAQINIPGLGTIKLPTKTTTTTAASANSCSVVGAVNSAISFGV